MTALSRSHIVNEADIRDGLLQTQAYLAEQSTKVVPLQEYRTSGAQGQI
jgi:hypothetical protein